MVIKNTDPFHFGRYVDEQVFRHNEREGTDHDRFVMALRPASGRRLTYKEPAGNATLATTV